MPLLPFESTNVPKNSPDVLPRGMHQGKDSIAFTESCIGCRLHLLLNAI
jgi:hypothetical protein